MHIYISHLPITITEKEVRDLVNPYGQVTAVHLVRDNHSGLPNGCAYVALASQIEADHAMAKLHESDYKGQRITVIQADAADFPTQNFW